MNLGMIWPCTAIWNAIAVHHGSLDSLVTMVTTMTMAAMMTMMMR
jgi:hypothetical protein